MNKLEYKIIRGLPSEVEVEVTKHLRLGYRVHGDPFLMKVPNTDTQYVCQAIIMENDNE
jgi:hypothetical protein